MYLTELQELLIMFTSKLSISVHRNFSLLGAHELCKTYSQIPHTRIITTLLNTPHPPPNNKLFLCIPRFRSRQEMCKTVSTIFMWHMNYKCLNLLLDFLCACVSWLSLNVYRVNQESKFQVATLLWSWYRLYVLRWKSSIWSFSPFFLSSSSGKMLVD